MPGGRVGEPTDTELEGNVPAGSQVTRLSKGVKDLGAAAAFAGLDFAAEGLQHVRPPGYQRRRKLVMCLSRCEKWFCGPFLGKFQDSCFDPADEREEREEAERQASSGSRVASGSPTGWETRSSGGFSHDLKLVAQDLASTVKSLDPWAKLRDNPTLLFRDLREDVFIERAQGAKTRRVRASKVSLDQSDGSSAVNVNEMMRWKPFEGEDDAPVRSRGLSSLSVSAWFGRQPQTPYEKLRYALTKGIPNLHTLELIGCRLLDPPPVLREVPSLKVLRLSRNRLKLLAQEWLWPAPARDAALQWPETGTQAITAEDSAHPLLEQLHLDWNSLYSIEVGALSGPMASKLMVVNLARNELGALPQDFLEGAEELRFLDLCNNKLTVLPDTMFDCRKLELLFLTHNTIEKLPRLVKTDEFRVRRSRLPKLRKLFLGYNQLTELPECIGGCAHLEKLRLMYNRIRELPESMVKLVALQELTFAGNPLQQHLTESKGLEHNLLMLAEYWRNKGEEMESAPRSLRNSKSSLALTSEEGSLSSQVGVEVAQSADDEGSQVSDAPRPRRRVLRASTEPPQSRRRSDATELPVRVMDSSRPRSPRRRTAPPKPPRTQSETWL